MHTNIQKRTEHDKIAHEHKTKDNAFFCALLHALIIHFALNVHKFPLSLELNEAVVRVPVILLLVGEDNLLDESPVLAPGPQKRLVLHFAVAVHEDEVRRRGVHLKLNC